MYNMACGDLVAGSMIHPGRWKTAVPDPDQAPEGVVPQSHPRYSTPECGRFLRIGQFVGFLEITLESGCRKCFLVYSVAVGMWTSLKQAEDQWVVARSWDELIRDVLTFTVSMSFHRPNRCRRARDELWAAHISASCKSKLNFTSLTFIHLVLFFFNSLGRDRGHRAAGVLPISHCMRGKNAP